MSDRDRPAQTPEGRLLQTAQRGRPAADFAPIARISPTRWRHIVNGYQPVGGGTSVPIVAPANTLARMASAVGLTAEQLEQVGRADAAAELRAVGELDDGVHRAALDIPPLPPELDDLIAIYLSAGEDEREVIVGQVRFLLRAVRPARERH